MIRPEALHDAMPVFAGAGLGHIVPLIEAALRVDLTADRLKRFTAAADARPDDLMDSADTAFTAMTSAAHRDGMAASAIVVGDTCLQICVIPATTWQGADDKVRFLATMIPWAWPRHPALGTVLEASRRAESVA